MRSAVLATAIVFTIVTSAALPAPARAGTVEDFARAWIKGESFALDRYHDDYRGTTMRDGILSVFRKPQLPDYFDKIRRQRAHIRVLAFTMLESKETGNRIEVSFWHRQIVGRGDLKKETQSHTTGTVVRGGPAGFQWLTTDTVDYFIRHIP